MGHRGVTRLIVFPGPLMRSKHPRRLWRMNRGDHHQQADDKTRGDGPQAIAQHQANNVGGVGTHRQAMATSQSSGR